MTTNKSSHAECTHPSTKSARAKCRTERAKVDTAALELIKTFDDRLGADRDWVTRGAIAFTTFERGGDRITAARALLDYFGPSGDEEKDRRRRANGYTITTSHSEILRIILRRFS